MSLCVSSAMFQRPLPPIPDELRLVFLSACGPWADEPIRALLERALSWPDVVAAARTERAVPILLRRLRSVDGSGVVPHEVLLSLAPMARVQDFRMGVLQERLQKLLTSIALGNPTTRIVLLKGAALAIDRFGGFASRPMSDLDLLVRQEDADPIHARALESGWVHPGRGLRVELYRDMHHLLPLDSDDGLGFGLEFHTELFPDWSPFRFGATDVWRDARPLPEDTLFGQVAVPSVEHQLLHASLHFAWSHCFARGAWRMVRDLDALLTDPGLDPEAFAELAEEVRGASCVHWTLAVLRELTGRVLPEPLFHLTRVPMPEPIHRRLRVHLARESLRPPEVPGTRRLRRTLWTLAIAPRRSGHGRGRPWTGVERWPDTEDPFGVRGRARESWGARIRGLIRYSIRLLGPRPAP